MLHLLTSDGFIEFRHPPAEERPSHWMIGIAVSGREYSVCRRIEEETGVNVYLPFEVKQRRIGRNRLTDVVVPVLRPYFFVPARISDQDYHDVKFTQGVLDFLQIERKPVVIRDSELETIRREEIYAEERRQLRIRRSGKGDQYMVGEAVDVNVGFATIRAIVDTVSKKRIKVKLEGTTLFGREVVEVDLGHVRRAD